MRSVLAVLALFAVFSCYSRDPVHQPQARDTTAVFCARGPEVLRELARLLTVAVQLWRS